jgi:hypothetical protein
VLKCTEPWRTTPHGGFDAEISEHRIGQVGVLAGVDPVHDGTRVPAKGMVDQRELDDLRSRTADDGHPEGRLHGLIRDGCFFDVWHVRPFSLERDVVLSRAVVLGVIDANGVRRCAIRTQPDDHTLFNAPN